MIREQVEKWKSEKGNPLLVFPSKRGEIERGDLSTCQLFNLSTKIESGKWIEEKKWKRKLTPLTIHYLLYESKGGKYGKDISC